MANRYFKNKDELSSEDRMKMLGGGALGFGGGTLMHNALASGDLTGRATLWHGTSPEAAENIKNVGLLPTTDQSAKATRVIKAQSPERYKNSLGKSYLARNKWGTYGYVAQATGNVNMFRDDVLDREKLIKDIRKGVVKFNVPLWKHTVVDNPELGGTKSYDEFKELIQKEFKERTGKDTDAKNFTRAGYKELKDGTVTIDGGVSTKYIKGSKDYQRNSIKEILEYARKNPKSFLRGAVKGGLGLGLLGMGGKLMYDSVKRDDDV